MNRRDEPMKMIRICLLAIAVAASGPALTNDLTVNATNPGDVGGNNGGAASVAINTYGSDGHAYRGAGVPGCRGAREHRPSREYYLPNYPHSISFCPGGEVEKSLC